MYWTRHCVLALFGRNAELDATSRDARDALEEVSTVHQRSVSGDQSLVFCVHPVGFTVHRDVLDWTGRCALL